MRTWVRLVMILFASLMVASCAPSDEATQTTDEHQDDEHEGEAEELTLPELEPANLEAEALQVVATTSIMGDVVAQVGGDAINLMVLMGPGEDPHSYQPAARDLTQVADAHVIFVHGWNLEEGLVDDLDTIGEEVPIVPIAANIEPLMSGGHLHDDDEHDDDEHSEDEHGNDEHDDEHSDEHAHTGADPHTWFAVENVKQWARNTAEVLGALDPANAASYQANADSYIAELDELDTYIRTQVEAIPAESRLLVTNHESLAYFADAYGFEVLGTVIPGASTVAEPSANQLAALIDTLREYNVCTVFAETTVSDALAQTVAAELSDCETVQVLTLYTGSVGPDGSGAESYISMFRLNVDTIVQGLQQP